MCQGIRDARPGGQPAHQDIPAGVISYSYDRLNRLSTEHHPSAGLTTHQYDLSGRRTTQISASGTTVFVYDPADQLTSKIEKPGLADIHNTYRPDGIRHGKEGPNGSEAFLRDPVAGEVVFWNRSSGGMSWQGALTPALSRRERENVKSRRS